MDCKGNFYLDIALAKLDITFGNYSLPEPFVHQYSGTSLQLRWVEMVRSQLSCCHFHLESETSLILSARNVFL